MIRAGVNLAATAREQATVALAMLDALEHQLAPIDSELRAYARRQSGCRALMAHYGIGALTAITILVELADARPALLLAPRGALRPDHQEPLPAPRSFGVSLDATLIAEVAEPDH